jgi:hypothetical protein
VKLLAFDEFVQNWSAMPVPAWCDHGARPTFLVAPRTAAFRRVDWIAAVEFDVIPIAPASSTNRSASRTSSSETKSQKLKGESRGRTPSRLLSPRRRRLRPSRPSRAPSNRSPRHPAPKMLFKHQSHQSYKLFYCSPGCYSAKIHLSNQSISLNNTNFSWYSILFQYGINQRPNISQNFLYYVSFRNQSSP